MTKEEFIDKYIKLSELEEYRTPDGYHIPGMAQQIAIACCCGDPLCEGWAMIANAPIEIECHRFRQEVRKERKNYHD